MSIYLGQSISVQCANDDEPTYAIFLGKSGTDFVAVDEDAEEIEISDVKDVDFIREPDALSPTGFKIYYGGLRKDILVGDLKLKCPNAAELKAEFQRIKKILKK